MHRPTKHDRKLTRLDAEAGQRWRWLTQVAFILSLALVICRALMTDSIRSSIDPLQGATPTPLAPGPGTGLALDLLCCVPALLVLARSALDESFVLLRSWVFWPMFMLGVLALASAGWASDKFSAIVSASHFAAATVFIWSTAQLVRSWLRVRMVVGASVGLLIALLVAGYVYRLSEFADLKDEWEHNRPAILEAQHIAPRSPEELQFGKRALGGEPMGFSASTNSYAAIVVLLGVVAAGAAVQRFADRDHWGWTVVPWLAVIASVPIIHWTRCRAAHATPIVAAGILIVIRFGRPLLRRLARPLYFASIIAIALITTIVVRHGLWHGTLWHDSLNFRWNYWVGSYHVLTQDLPRHEFKQFLLGVGWENFGPHYLAHRLQVAAEEIRDPHNFIVRVCVELGIIGGTLMPLWMLKLWWELTRPVMPASENAAGESEYGTRAATLAILAVAGLAIVLNTFLSIDFDAQGAFVFIELVRRIVFAAAIVVGMAGGALAMGQGDAPTASGEIRYHLDGRPAPWVPWAMLAALATFLIHNLIEFSFFEAGPMFLFALLTASALGLRLSARQPLENSQRAQASLLPRRILLAGAGIAWVVFAATVFVPIAVAEGDSHDADANARAGRWPQAVQLLEQAHGRVPYNADYAMREAKCILHAGAMRDATALGEARKWMDIAIAADPSSVADLVARAELELLPSVNDPAAAQRDYRRVLVLDPANIRLRIEYATALKDLAARTHDSRYAGEALGEFYRAEDRNEQYHWDEPKRLSPEELAAVRAAIKELEGPQAAVQPNAPVSGPGRRDRGM